MRTRMRAHSLTHSHSLTHTHTHMHRHRQRQRPILHPRLERMQAVFSELQVDLPTLSLGKRP